MAISKERLEELIEQEAIIWFCQENGYIDKIQLKQDWYIIDNYLYEKKLSKYTMMCWNINRLFESKEKCKEYWEWEEEFGCIERTERLELPTWKQIENIIEQKKKFGLNHSDRVLARIITGDSIYYLKLCKDLDLFTLQLKQTYIGDDLCEQITTRFPYMLGIATKENYIKACRKAKELFLGETK